VQSARVHLACALQAARILLVELDAAIGAREQARDQRRRGWEGRRCIAFARPFEPPAVPEQPAPLALYLHAAADRGGEEVAREAAHVVAAALQIAQLRGRASLG